MRALDRLISFVFSIIMLAVSVILILVGIGVVNPQMIIDMLQEQVFVTEMLQKNIFNTVTIAGIVLLIASLKTTIFLSLFKTKDKAPILVKTQNGEVEIAQETIISTVRSVGATFSNIKEVQAKMIKKRRGIVIYAMLMVYANSNIRELTEQMQRQVKEVIKATTGVDVLEVNIKVKNIYQKQKNSNEVDKVIQEVKAQPKEEKIEKVVEENIPEKEDTIIPNDETVQGNLVEENVVEEVKEEEKKEEA